MDAETNKITVGTEAVLKWKQYQQAFAARARWVAEEKRLKEELLIALGYDQDDEKPESVVAEDGGGQPVCKVTVGARKGLDTKYLRERHPDIYAECERWTHPISIRSAK